MKALLFSFLISLTIGHLATAQSSDWKQQLQQELEAFKSCMNQNENGDCRTVLGKSIKLVYNINDFYNAQSGGYLTPQDIGSELAKTNEWKSLGFAYNQDALIEGQKAANTNKPVLAVYRDEEGQALHAVMLLPGELQASGSWNLKVPKVASFFTHEPEKSFVDKTMAYAFSKTMLLRIELYARI
ncbi:MAG: hypothetical protein AAF632_29740 [Bacteroidota bacterium]